MLPIISPLLVDGGFTAWSPWAGCSVTCEQGIWGRTRSCSNPAPQHGGANCAGPTAQTTACDAGVMCPSKFIRWFIATCTTPINKLL